MACKLFGIDVTDRVSRLVAADAAEERSLTELATALRDLDKPLVVEPGEPPTVLPLVTRWLNSEPKPGWREPQGLLLRLMQVGYRTANLQFTPAYFNAHTAATALERWSLDAFEQGTHYVNLPPKALVVVVPGVVIVGNTSIHPRRPTFFVCFDDAPRFGFNYVPAFA